MLDWAFCLAHNLNIYQQDHRSIGTTFLINLQKQPLNIPSIKVWQKKSKINDKRSSWEYQTLKIVVLFSRLITSINRILYAPRFLTQIVFFASLLTKAYTSIHFDGKWSSACVVPFYVVYFPLYPPLPLPPLEGAGGGGFLYLGKNWSHYQIQQLSHGSCLIKVEYDTYVSLQGEPIKNNISHLRVKPSKRAS